MSLPRRSCFLSCLCVLLAIAAVDASADPPEAVGRIAFVEGSVSFVPDATAEQWSQAALNYPLIGGNRFWTDSASRSELDLGSGNLRMDERTAVDVLRLDPQQAEVFVGRGSITASLAANQRDTGFRVSSPSGYADLRVGGAYRVDVSEQGDATTVTVRAGSADVSTGTASFTLQPGQSAVLYGGGAGSGGAYELREASDYSPLERWTAERDQLLLQGRTSRNLPPQMVGAQQLDAWGTWQSDPQLGTIWVPTYVDAGWVPYRNGHWAWVSPWGWTWIDDAPWGFAPFHYGRWAYVGNYWAWVPGQVVSRPIYAPALVAFVDNSGPDRCGWIPLGPREPYHPWYEASRRHFQEINSGQVEPGRISALYDRPGTARYVNARVAGAATIVPQRVFAGGQQVMTATVAANGPAPAAVVVTVRPPVARPEPGAASVTPIGRRPPPETVRAVDSGRTPSPGKGRADNPGRSSQWGPVPQAAPAAAAQAGSRPAANPIRTPQPATAPNPTTMVAPAAARINAPPTPPALPSATVPVPPPAVVRAPPSVAPPPPVNVPRDQSARPPRPSAPAEAQSGGEREREKRQRSSGTAPGQSGTGTAPPDTSSSGRSPGGQQSAPPTPGRSEGPAPGTRAASTGFAATPRAGAMAHLSGHDRARVARG